MKTPNNPGTLFEGGLFPVRLRFPAARGCLAYLGRLRDRDIPNDLAGCRVANFDNVSL